MYLINKDETEHTGQVNQHTSLCTKCVNKHNNYCDTVMWLILCSFKLPSVSDPCCGYVHFESFSMLQAKCLLDPLTASETPFLW